jgi:glycosyltransferase involved in cell wall biosynthesis
MLTQQLSSPATDGPFRVAFLIANLAQAGAEKQLVYMAKALHSAGAIVRVYVLESGNFLYERLLRETGITVECFGQVPFPPIRVIHITSKLARFRPHIVQSIPAFMNLYSGLAARWIGAFGIGGLRSDLERSRRMYGRLTRWLLTANHAIVANSAKCSQELKQSRILSQDRVYVLPNVIDTAQFPVAPAGTGSSSNRTVLYLGRLISIKRVDIFLRSLAIISHQMPSVRGIVAGDGPERAALERLAASLGLTECVTFVGHQGDVASLFRNTACLVLCSDAEGFPNVALEAMAAGVPIIATPAGDLANIIEHGKTGFIVDFGDAEAISMAAARLIASPEMRLAMGKAARERVLRLYSLDALKHRLLAIYADVVRRKQRVCRPLNVLFEEISTARQADGH